MLWEPTLTSAPTDSETVPSELRVAPIVLAAPPELLSVYVTLVKKLL